MKINTEETPIRQKFTIHVMGILEFKNVMLKNNFNDDNIEDNKHEFAVISITCGDNSTDNFIPLKHGMNDEHYFKSNHANVLNMEFYDIDETIEKDGKKYESFSAEQAKRLIDFIEVNQNKHYLIHCHAGISRSGAVGQFITDFYGWADKATFNFQYRNRIIPNVEVTKKLKEEWMKRYAKLDVKEYQEMLNKNETK
jgi:predicted protein tyrosine phosphatase